jgi:8-oxo-dGTP diphosphatase
VSTEQVRAVAAAVSGADDGGEGVAPVVSGSVVALAVVTGPVGVLVGRRRDGVPLWVYPCGKVHPGESVAQAAVRECGEETGLEVRAEHEIGGRIHPVIGRYVVYLACTVVTATAVRTPPSPELVELRWLDMGQVAELMPDVHDSVRGYLHLRFILRSAAG